MTIIGGDGLEHEAVRLEEKAGYSVDFVATVTGEMIKSEFRGAGVASLGLNDAFLDGHPFLGRCLKAGDSWTVAHRTPGDGIVLSVLEANDNRIVARAEVQPYQMAVYGNGTVTWKVVHEFIWRESRAYPDEVRAIRTPGNETSPLVIVSRLLHQEVVPMDVQPRGSISPVGTPAAVGQWPDFASVDLDPPFKEFTNEVESRQEVADYFKLHPDAYASWVKYERVRENESTAMVWTALLRDDSDDGMSVELVKRCFDNLVHRVLYGDCHYNHQYFGPPGTSPDAPTLYVEPMPIRDDKTSVGIADVFAIASGFTATEDIVRVQWGAHPFQEGPPWERGAAIGRPGWVVESGEIRGQMIITSQGPYGTTAGYDRDVWDVKIDGVGWALGRPLLPGID